MVLNSKGQVTIPAALRERHGLHEGDEVDVIEEGKTVLVFPEGRHTEDGRMWQFRSGVGLLANNLRIPILPMRIDGLFELKRAGKRIAPPGKIHVSIGKPVQFPPETDSSTIAQELQKIVESL